MSTEANMFDDADNAPPPGEGGVYFQPGTYIVRVDRFFRHTNRQQIPGAIAEMTILHSTNHAAHPPGSAVSWMQRNNKDGWQGRVRKFVAEVQGVAYDDVKKDVLYAASGSVNPLGGKVVMVEAYNTTTRKNTPIVGVSFKRLPPDALVQWTQYAASVKVATPMQITDN